MKSELERRRNVTNKQQDFSNFDNATRGFQRDTRRASGAGKDDAKCLQSGIRFDRRL